MWDSIWYNVNLVCLNRDNDYGIIEDGAVAVANGKIAWLGFRKDLLGDISKLAKAHHDLKGYWLTPGLIDCHTHLIYAGHRYHEFSKRIAGKTYTEIAEEGGGILATVAATRQATSQQLLQESAKRLTNLIAQGVTCLEIKSGYGLSLESERKILEVANKLAVQFKVDIKKTFLGAHCLPPEYKMSADEYIDYLINIMLPTLAKENLVDYVDVFCEKIAFSLTQSDKIFCAAHALNLPLKLHADQLSNMKAAQLAANYNAISADHLEYADEEGIQAMAESGTVAVLLPGAYYFMQEKRIPPIDLFKKYRIQIAIATDCNPGTSPTSSLLLMLNMACIFFRLSPCEALMGVTRFAARALGMQATYGSLAIGHAADFAIWHIQHPDELSYYMGENFCMGTVKNGEYLMNRIGD